MLSFFQCYSISSSHRAMDLDNPKFVSLAIGELKVQLRVQNKY